LEIEAQRGEWDIETCIKMRKEDTSRDKWAKILLRMKGNIPEIRLRQPKYPQQGTEELHTKASDRKNRSGNNNKKIWKDKNGKNDKKKNTRRKTATMNKKMKREQTYRTCPTK